MIDLQLDADEGILLQATEIERYGEREDVLDELILTNKNLIWLFIRMCGIENRLNAT